MKKFYYAFLALFLLVILAACNTPEPLVLTFAQEPTAVMGQLEGTIVIDAEIEGDVGTIFYIVVPKNAITPTAEQVVAGIAYGTATIAATGNSGTSTSISDLSVQLVSSTEYTVYFVVQHETTLSSVKTATATAKDAAVVLGFTSIALSTGDNNGELKVNIAKSGTVGTVYYIIVAEGSTAPTKEEIVANANYGNVTIVDSNSGAGFANHVISDLTAGARYTLYTVVKHETLYSIIRNMSAASKEVIQTVDKGEGTLESPFQISTISDLEQIGKGYYALDEKEWNMDSHYVLMNNIDLSTIYGEGKLNWPVLGADTLGARFAGVLDGNGFSIDGLYVGSTSTAGVYRGLFASSEHTALVKNLTFNDAYVIGAGIDESNSNHGTGVLYGYFKGTVEHISILNATVMDTGSRVGGLAGRSYETGHVSNTYVHAKVQGLNRVGGIAGVVDVSDTTAAPIMYQNVVFEGEVIGEQQHIGGLVGYLRGVQMSNVFVTGYIQGSQEVGGIAGFYQKRAANNNVESFIKNAVVYATVYGTTGVTTIGNIVGQVSTSNINVDNAHLLKIENTFHVEGTQAFNGGDLRAVLGTSVSKADFASSAWMSTNLPTWDFVNTWEIKSSAERPTLKMTTDEGKLGELSTPLVIIPNVVSGDQEKELVVRLTSNKTNTTIYYIVVASEGSITSEKIKNPGTDSSVLFSGNGTSINETLVMAEFDTLYYVYYYAEHTDGNSNILLASAKSKEMTALVVTGGLRPGEASKEIITTLTSNLTATIYYIIVAAEATFTKEQIKTPTNVLFSGSGASIDTSHIMPLEETTYYIYAYAEMTDRVSIVFNASGLSSSDTYVNYGTGSIADPFILRTVTDLENIGNSSYINEAGTALAYLNTAHYQLANDLDLTVKYGEGKLNWTPITEFFGVLDGNGFSIKGLYINNTASVTHNGLFGYLRTDAVVKNLTLDTVYINVNGQVSDGNTGMTGAIAGRMNSARMENIRIINAVILTQGFRVGALAGGNEGSNGSFKNIYVEAEVTGLARVGGLVGNISNNSNAPFVFDNVVFIGRVNMIGTSDYRVGGIVGWARGVQVNNAYIEGYIGGVGAYAGGVAGYLENYNDTTQFSQITNTVVNIVVTSTVGRAGSLIGSVSSTVTKIPTLLNNYQTLQTTMVIEGTPNTSVRHATPADLDTWTASTYETNTPGLSTANGWTFLALADRPSLLNSPDLGSIQELVIPLQVTTSVTKGDVEKEIDIMISTNKTNATIYYVVTSANTFTASEIQNAVVGETFLAIGTGATINDVKVMPLASTSYVVSYIVVIDGIPSVVMTKTVTSGDEAILTLDVTAVTGLTNPGDIDLVLNTQSHSATVYVYVLAQGVTAPTTAEIISNGQIITTSLTVNRTAGLTYVAYYYGVKTVGQVHSVITTIDVVAKAEPVAPFTLSVKTLVENNQPGELVLTLQASHDSSIYYLVQLATESAPSNNDIETLGTLLTESPKILSLLSNTEYKVYVIAMRTGSSDMESTTLTATTKRELYNGLQTASFFPIYTLEDLEDFRTGMNSSVYSNTATVEFEANLDFAATYGPSGKNWVPIGTNARKYRGFVEGNNHVLNGLYINLAVTVSDMNEGTGLFGTTDNGFSIQNLHFTNVNITGNISVGVVAGYTKIVLLSNVSVDGGTVTSVNTSDSRVGGIFGRLNANSATNSIFEKAWVNVVVNGHKHVGGMIGHVDYSIDAAVGEIIIRDVYAMGTVNSPLLSSPNVGGIVGYNRGSIIRAVAYNTINNTETPASQVASIAGYVQRRNALSPEAKVLDSIGYTNILKIVGSSSTANGTIQISNNYLVVAENPASGQILLADLINTANWGVTIPLTTLDWEVVNNKAILKNPQ